MKRSNTMINKSKKEFVEYIKENLFHKYNNYCCPFCSTLPEIFHYNERNGTIKLKCKKHGENTLKIREYLQKMRKWEKNVEIELRNMCKLHNKEYEYYCNDCQENICIKCLKDLSIHENHIKYKIKSLSPSDTEISLIKERISICLQKKDELLRKIKNLEDTILFYDTLINSYERQSPNYLLNINIKHLVHGEKLNLDSIKNTELIMDKKNKNEIFEDFVKRNFLESTEGLNQLNLKNKNIGNDLLVKLINNIENSNIFNLLKDNGKLKSPTEIINLKNIKYLNLRGNKISSLDFLSGKDFPILEILSLSDNEISSIDNLKDISFPLLSELYLSKNKIINIDVLSELNIIKLRILWLSNNLITSIGIFEKVKFPELTILGLNKNKIKNILVLEKKKAKFPQLYELYLNDNEINKKLFYKTLKDLYKRVQEFYC